MSDFCSVWSEKQDRDHNALELLLLVLSNSVKFCIGRWCLVWVCDNDKRSIWHGEPS